MNIVIVGFMGTGKTTVAKALAGELGKSYVSMDDMIASKEGKPINDIFAQNGEPYFRKAEKEAAKELSGQDGLVIDAGGGVVLDEENIRNLKRNGKLICLKAGPEAIYKRVKRDRHRPLLNVPDPRARIKEILHERAPFYQKADIHIETSNKTIPEIIQEIIGQIQDNPLTA